MFIRKKLWLGIGAALVTTTTLSSCDALDLGGNSQGSKTVQTAGEGGEGGEGGENGAAANADAIASSDVAYLGQLALIRGHLNVGLDLYRSGAQDAAATHMKHPEDELYTDLVPGLEARGAAGFSEELAALAIVVEARGPVAEADAAYQSLLKAIAKAEAKAGAPQPQTLGRVITDLARTAAKEYDIAVDEKGVVVNAHEYQDALGFIRVAEELAAVLADSTDDAEEVGEIKAQLEALLAQWPGLVPPQTVEMEPSVVYGAAAHIELAALSLK